MQLRLLEPEDLPDLCQNPCNLVLHEETVVENEQKIQTILESDLALGHKIQYILEQIHGLENERARQVTKTVAKVVERHFNALAATFIREGFVQCAAALRFEAELFFAG